MRKLEISKWGEIDIDDIVIYHSRYYETTSSKITNKLLRKFEILLEFPRIGRRLRDKYGIKSDSMCTYCLKYIIIYKYNNDVVLIERVLNCRRDFIKELL